MLAKPEANICVRTVPIASLFIDAQDCKIFVGDKRVPHDSEGPGYQRDPWVRIRWLEDRVKDFDPHLLRLLEVSPRPDGTYAIIDGGGRFLLAQLVGGIFDMQCRVHEGLTRTQEAELFVKMDKQKVGLSAVNIFLADLAAGDEDKIRIAEHVEPYRIAPNGNGTLRCVGQLEIIADVAGVRLLSRTARVVAAVWGKFNGEWPTRRRGDGSVTVDGQAFMAVALALQTGIDEGKLREAMAANFPKTLKARATENMPPMATTATGVRMAEKLVQLAKPTGGFKALQAAIRDSRLCEAYVNA